MTSRIDMRGDSEFIQLASALLSQLDEKLDAFFNDNDIDGDIERSGGVLTAKLPSKQVIVINLQSPMAQVWLASPLGAYHYAYQNGGWQDTRGGLALEAQLAASLKTLTGKTFQM